MSSSTRVVVAMSGGVDSSTAALIARDQGFDTLGVTLRLWNPADPEGAGRGKSCCSPSEVEDAARVARTLGIPHYVLDYAEPFRREVIDPFVAEYVAGRTPIPCVLCNQKLKFGRLLDSVRKLGAEALVTGHYARLAAGRGSAPRLLRARDRAKDQSYFLFSIQRSDLGLVRFPLGELAKEEVRARAQSAGLPVAAKPDSQEICFVPDGDQARFVERVGGRAATGLGGFIKDGEGRILGEHAGIHRYTVGQRRGLGLGGGEARYVLAIDGGSRELQVGPRASLAHRRLEAERPSWLTASPPSRGSRVEAQIRSRHSAAPAVIERATRTGLELRFDQPQEAIAPGQAVVLYRGERVLGGAWIQGASA